MPLVLCLIGLFSIKIEIVYSFSLNTVKYQVKQDYTSLMAFIVVAFCKSFPNDAHKQMSHGGGNKNSYNDAREIFNARK